MLIRFFWVQPFGFSTCPESPNRTIFEDCTLPNGHQNFCHFYAYHYWLKYLKKQTIKSYHLKKLRFQRTRQLKNNVVQKRLSTNHWSALDITKNYQHLQKKLLVSRWCNCTRLHLNLMSVCSNQLNSKRIPVHLSQMTKQTALLHYFKKRRGLEWSAKSGLLAGSFDRANKPSVSINGGNFLTRWVTISFSRRILLYVVTNSYVSLYHFM